MRLFKLAVFLVLSGIFAVSIQAQDNQEQPETLLHVTDIAWSNDGSKIAAAGIQGEHGYLTVLDSQTGETIYALNPRPGGFASVAWSPDDRFVAAGGYEQTIWIIDVAAQSHVATLSGHQATVTTVDWSSDGTKLVSGGIWDQRVILWDMLTYAQIRSLEIGDPWSVEFSPDDQRIAVGGLAGLFVFPSTLDVGSGREQNPYRFAEAYVGGLAWSHDGSRVAFGTQTFSAMSAAVNVLDSDTGTVLANFQTDDEAIFGLAWSLDDTLIAAQSIDGVVRLWDTKSGVLLESLPDSSGAAVRYPEQIDFSPYGGRLAYGGTLPAGAATAPTALQRNAQGVSLAGGAVHIVVPAPSRERLQGIADLCGATPAIERAVNADIAAADLATLSAAVEALPDDAIPPACAADLIAVAEALQNQP